MTTKTLPKARGVDVSGIIRSSGYANRLVNLFESAPPKVKDYANRLMVYNQGDVRHLLRNTCGLYSDESAFGILMKAFAVDIIRGDPYIRLGFVQGMPGGSLKRDIDESRWIEMHCKPGLRRLDEDLDRNKLDSASHAANVAGGRMAVLKSIGFPDQSIPQVIAKDIFERAGVRRRNSPDEEFHEVRRLVEMVEEMEEKYDTGNGSDQPEIVYVAIDKELPA